MVSLDWCMLRASCASSRVRVDLACVENLLVFEVLKEMYVSLAISVSAQHIFPLLRICSEYEIIICTMTRFRKFQAGFTRQTTPCHNVEGAL
jgi:hypothetical protein